MSSLGSTEPFSSSELISPGTLQSDSYQSDDLSCSESISRVSSSASSDHEESKPASNGKHHDQIKCEPENQLNKQEKTTTDGSHSNIAMLCDVGPEQRKVDPSDTDSDHHESSTATESSESVESTASESPFTRSSSTSSCDSSRESGHTDLVSGSERVSSAKSGHTDLVSGSGEVSYASSVESQHTNVVSGSEQASSASSAESQHTDLVSGSDQISSARSADSGHTDMVSGSEEVSSAKFGNTDLVSGLKQTSVAALPSDSPGADSRIPGPSPLDCTAAPAALPSAQSERAPSSAETVPTAPVSISVRPQNTMDTDCSAHVMSSSDAPSSPVSPDSLAFLEAGTTHLPETDDSQITDTVSTDPGAKTCMDPQLYQGKSDGLLAPKGGDHPISSTESDSSSVSSECSTTEAETETSSSESSLTDSSDSRTTSESGSEDIQGQSYPGQEPTKKTYHHPTRPEKRAALLSESVICRLASEAAPEAPHTPPREPSPVPGVTVPELSSDIQPAVEPAATEVPASSTAVSVTASSESRAERSVRRCRLVEQSVLLQTVSVSEPQQPARAELPAPDAARAELPAVVAPPRLRHRPPPADGADVETPAMVARRQRRIRRTASSPEVGDRLVRVEGERPPVPRSPPPTMTPLRRRMVMAQQNQKPRWVGRPQQRHLSMLGVDMNFRLN